MNYTKNKFLAIVAVSSIVLTNVSLSFADANKDAVITNINNSIANINVSTTWTGKMIILKDVVYSLSSDFSTLYSSVWLDDSDISALVSLWKLNVNYKKDLVLEYASLKSDLDSKYAINSSQLNSMKDEINLSYTSLTSTQKQSYQSKIDTINAALLEINSYADTKTSALKTKYTAILNTAKTNLKSIFSANSSDLAKLKKFSSSFSSLASKKESLDKNYSNFKSYYLGWNISELSDFLWEKKIYYSDLMKTQLTKMLDSNKEVNTGLNDYNKELTDYINFTSNKFALELEKNLDDNYSIIYSQTKMDNFNTSYNDFKSKYLDLDLTLKSKEVLSDYSGAISLSSELLTEANSLDNKLANLSVTWTVNIANVKVTLENQIIEYYNSKFTLYKADLIIKLKEKLEDLSVVNDLIETKYSKYKDDLALDSSDTNFNSKINDFKTFLAKYEDSSNATIRTKVSKIQYFLETSYLNRELALDKYKYFSHKRNSYEEQMNSALSSLDKKLWDKFLDRTAIIFDRIDTAMTKKITIKTKYKLQIIKLSIRNYIYKNKM